MNKRRVGVLGFGRKTIQSLERSRKVYLSALQTAFQIEELPEDEQWRSRTDLDALVVSPGNHRWSLQQRPKIPLVLPIHGGAVLNLPAINKSLKNMLTTDILVGNCTSDASLLSAISGKRAPSTLILPLPVDTNIFKPQHSRSSVRNNFDIRKEDLVIGFVARLIPQKNLHHFLELLASLRRVLAPRTVLAFVVGDFHDDYPILRYTSEYSSVIQWQIDRQQLNGSIIRVSPSIDDHELAKIYAAMDLLIHPSVSVDENFGYVPVEAMAAGTPVIATAYGGMKDSILHGRTGFLVDSWCTPTGIRLDSICLLNRATELLTNDELRNKMSRASVDWVHERFSTQQFAEKLCSAITVAVEQGKKAASTRCKGGRPIPKTGSAPKAIVLPAVDPPLSYFEFAIGHYVSRKGAPMQGDILVKAVASLSHIGRKRFTVLEPAWPAQITLTAGEAALLSHCMCCRRVTELRNKDQARVKKLLKIGLLISSNNEARIPPDSRELCKMPQAIASGTPQYPAKQQTSNKSPKVSIVIPWCDRDEITLTLTQNIRQFRQVKAEIIIVNCGGRLEKLLTAVSIVQATELRVLHIPCKTFNKSLASNIGIKASRSPVIWCLDSDVVIGHDVLNRQLQKLGSRSFVTAKVMCESSPAKEGIGLAVAHALKGTFLKSIIPTNFVTFEFKDGNTCKVCTSSADLINGTRSGGGQLLARKTHLISIAGYNSNLRGWGWHDNDIQVRLMRMLKLSRREEGVVTHISHDDGSRDIQANGKDDDHIKNFVFSCGLYSQGDFHGTFDKDVAEWFPLIEEYNV